jgi:uncharacterized protein (DUF362 family)
MKSKVVIIRNQKAWRNGKIDVQVLNEMLHEGMLKLSDKESVEDAWSLYFKAEEKIALKVNTITNDPAVSTHHELTTLVGNGIISTGVKSNDITVFDRGIKCEQATDNICQRKSLEDAGYIKNTSNNGIRIFEAKQHDDWKKMGCIKNRFFKAITDIDGHVNMPILKDHHIMGVTFALKNYLGTLTNPELLHKNAGIPYIADLNAMPEIKDSLRLIIGDMLKCQYNKGPHNNPKYHWNENAIILSADPVAIDAVAFEILKAKRNQYGLEYAKMAFGGEPGKYIIDACRRKNLGEAELEKIDLIEINQ